MTEEAKPLSALVMGVGNLERGDDGVGPLVVDLLRELAPEGIALRSGFSDGPAMVEAWQGFARVIAVDAVRGPSPPGTLHRIDAIRDPLPASLVSRSTHGFGLREAVELARVLGQLPGELTIYGVEAEHFELGRPMSEAVAESARNLAPRILRELA
jgi:hydrogenase maturation protease